MKKMFLLAAVIAVVLTIGLGFGYAQTVTQGYAQGGWYCPWHNQAMGQGYARQNTGGWYCPMMGGGYVNGRTQSPRYGMMGQGGCMGYGWGYRGRGPNPQYGSGYQYPNQTR